MSQDHSSTELSATLSRDAYPIAEAVYNYWIKQRNSGEGIQKTKYTISYEPHPELPDEFLRQYKAQLPGVAHLVSGVDGIVDESGSRDVVCLVIKEIRLPDKARAEVEVNRSDSDAIQGYLLELTLRDSGWAVESVHPLWIACFGG